MRTGVVVLVLAGLGGAVRADVVTDTFDPGSNLGGWTFGGPFGSVLPSGGNPGAYWNEPDLDTFAPRLRTTSTNSPFHGDYRSRQVMGLSVDLILFHVDFSAGGRPLSLILVSDNNTPGNPDDDWGAFTMHAQNVPLVGEGWRHYDFDVPSQSAALPAGWEFIEFGPGASPNWNSLVTGVDGVEFFYGDPRNFFIFQMWDTGADNVAISSVPAPASSLGLVLASAVRRRGRTRQ
ncbi:hypothetical protein PHYC_02429 [Phycisphaerales bacterium]|nr:hypothetical protein PHYC_02429 [Phycisphaerales bacterium]